MVSTETTLQPGSLRLKLSDLLPDGREVLRHSSEVLSDGTLVLVESGVDVLLHVGKLSLEVLEPTFVPIGL